MIPLKIRSVPLGSGIPKIIVPISGRTPEEVLKAASAVPGSAADLVEWRADGLETAAHPADTEIPEDTAGGIFPPALYADTASALRRLLGDMPLLFTFRTKKEGGPRDLSPASYEALNCAAAKSGAVDLVDIEVLSQPQAGKLIEKLHGFGVRVIGSNHTFSGTPAKDELLRRLAEEDAAGADILKLAVMPQTSADVLTLLSVTDEARRRFPDRPLITMSMAKLGIISRLSGEVFGSAATFGTLGKASAPGQIPAEELRRILEILHRGT